METKHETMIVIGMRLPVIATVEPGLSVVAHPNGIALATEHSIGTVDSFLGSDVIRASQALRAAAKSWDVIWPMIRERYYPTEESVQQALHPDQTEKP